MQSPIDVLVIGAGPAALCIAAALVERGLQVQGLAPHHPAEPWPNTFGIWGPELDELALQDLLEHRWSHCNSYFPEIIKHKFNYGLFNKDALQKYWLDQCLEAGVQWQLGSAAIVEHHAKGSIVISAEAERFAARIVIDASGHQSPLVQRRQETVVASQAAYGIVGRFSAAPVLPDQFVLMDYRSDHLSAAEVDNEPATFLYAMDLGADLFFVEETSLALAPAVPYQLLKERLLRRLAKRNVEPVDVIHEEFCLFPMNLPLPNLQQQLLAFGSAASMVHPASGYLIGALLRRAPSFADAIAAGIADPELAAAVIAKSAWRVLWPFELRAKRAIYCFGLNKLMRFKQEKLQQFFVSFFALPQQQWLGFLTNQLTFLQLLAAMLRLFISSPFGVRWGLLL